MDARDCMQKQLKEKRLNDCIKTWRKKSKENEKRKKENRLCFVDYGDFLCKSNFSGAKYI